MALTMTGNKPFKTTIPEDTYVAVCIGIYDVGTEKSEQFKSESKKVVVLWEIPELKDAEGWPVTISKKYTQSLNKKANLYKELITWRGKNFTAEETKNFDLKTFLGKPASIQVIHQQGTGDKIENVYANIVQVSGLPRGMVAPAPSREPLFFDFDDKKAVIPEGTPEFIAKMIVASPEWDDIKSGRAIGSSPPNGASRAVSGQQAPAEIVGLLNEIGLAWPYTREELDDKFDPAAMGDQEYNLLTQYENPF